jgi:ParB family chromosome partitioning protein
MADDASRSRLGRGLAALMGDVGVETQAVERTRSARKVPIEFVHANPRNPRKLFSDAELEGLSASIKERGIIQPLVVRARGADNFEIIAGERRWRAAQLAELNRVPVVVKDVGGDHKRLLEMALIENIQREDLNPMEAAAAYQRLVDEFDLRQDDIAAQVGKDRATVANYLRLLKLPEEVRANVASGVLSMGHARAIVALTSDSDQKELARDVVARGLSVRETEALVKKAIGDKGAKASAGQARSLNKKDVHTRAAEEQLHLALGTPVEIKRKRKGGIIAITFTNENELQRLYEYLTEKR